MPSSLDDLCDATLTEVAARVERRDVSPVELTRAVLERIERVDGRLHSYLTVTADAALAQARAAEAEIARGRYRGPLHGIPIGIKDLCATKGVRTTCASRVLAEWAPDYDATVVARLADAGAVCLGKLNMTEFALSGYAPSAPIPLNPWSAGHYPGGSSSGSGVAVAAGLCFAAIGTDTGGSIRFPAACCGVVGLKPTYGRVSRFGVFPLAESLDHVGPLARSVADCAVMLGAIAGFDPRDATSRRLPVPDYRGALGESVKGLRLGIDERYLSDGVQPEVTTAALEAAGVLTGLGAETVAVDVGVDGELAALWPPLCGGDAALAHAPFFPARSAEYGVTFRTFLEYAAGLSAADYARAHVRRLSFAIRLRDVFADIDFLVCPSMPMLPMSVEFVAPYAVFSTAIAPIMRFTAPFNASGNPTLSLPSGFTDDGLPHSVQLVGRHFDEALLCRVGHAYERATPWHARRPPAAAR